MEKKDRMMELAAKARKPIIFFAEGGGGRPGDVEGYQEMDHYCFGKYSEGSLP